MRIDCSLAVALSLADTCTMPLASMSKVTSICGMPRGAGGMPTRSNWPSSLLSAAISRSPWETRMVTAFWPSSAVENTWLFLVGMVVLRSISRVNTPPSVSMPSDSGVTSSSSTSLTSPLSTPAWMAAPTATTSSGLTPLCGSLPNSSLTSCCTFGMRVMPPTSTTSWMSAALRPASLIACLAGALGLLDQVVDQALELGAGELHGQMQRRLRLRVHGDERQVDLGLLRGGELDLGLLGRFLQALQGELVAPEIDRFSFLNSLARYSTRRMSKSSPPRKVSPLVDFTSNTPSPISRIEMSKVPPPRS